MSEEESKFILTNSEAASFSLMEWHNLPTRLTINSYPGGTDQIVLEFDRANNRWDVTVTGDQTEAFKSFATWMVNQLPICKCGKMDNK